MKRRVYSPEQNALRTSRIKQNLCIKCGEEPVTTTTEGKASLFCPTCKPKRTNNYQDYMNPKWQLRVDAPDYRDTEHFKSGVAGITSLLYQMPGLTMRQIKEVVGDDRHFREMRLSVAEPFGSVARPRYALNTETAYDCVYGQGAYQKTLNVETETFGKASINKSAVVPRY